MKDKTIEKKSWLSRLWGYFTPYERSWFLITFGVLVISMIFFFDVVVGTGSEPGWETVYAVCTIVYIISSITCELLIAKQSRWNFIVSLVFVQTTMFAIYFLDHAYSLAIISLVFWGIVSTISFINWTKHKDHLDEYLTKVRRFTIKQDIIIAIGIIVFTVGVGYLISLLSVPDPETTWFIHYVEAGLEAVGMANGLLILYRFREQWIVWIIYNLLEAMLWIITGNYILLIQNVALIINSTYGVIKWTKYAKSHPESTKLSIIDHGDAYLETHKEK